MHYWGDKNVDWKGINDAARYIGDFLVRWGRINVRDVKEKYGECRIYCSFGWNSLHSITHPRHVFCKYPKWLAKLDLYYFSKFVSLFNPIVVRYQEWVYKIAYRKAVKKWPHLRKEILYGADFPELIEGGLE